MRLAFVLLLLLLPLPTAGQGSCRAGAGTVTGRLVTAQGLGVTRGLVRALPMDCGTLIDSLGNFTMGGLPADSVLLAPQALGFCMVPRWVPTNGGPPQQFEAVLERNPLDDSFVMVRGTPYTPLSYEQSRCRYALEWHLGGRVGEPIPVPTPSEVLALVMREPSVIELLATAAELSELDPVPVAFRYGPVDGALPSSSTGYIIGGYERDAGMYILVEVASPLHLSVQVGRPSYVSSEVGFQLEWRREPGSEWSNAAVTGRWGGRP